MSQAEESTTKNIESNLPKTVSLKAATSVVSRPAHWGNLVGAGLNLFSGALMLGVTYFALPEAERRFGKAGKYGIYGLAILQACTLLVPLVTFSTLFTPPKPLDAAKLQVKKPEVS